MRKAKLEASTELEVLEVREGHQRPGGAHRVPAMIGVGRLPIGGYPKLNVAGGDSAPVLTPNGTVILIRTANHPPRRPRYATPYVELPPTATTAWMGAMNELDLWLCTKPVHENDFLLFPLLGETETGSLKLELFYDPATNTTHRGPYSYDSPQDQLSPTELKDRAKQATYFKPQG